MTLTASLKGSTNYQSKAMINNNHKYETGKYNYNIIVIAIIIIIKEIVSKWAIRLPTDLLCFYQMITSDRTIKIFDFALINQSVKALYPHKSKVVVASSFANSA